jgi:hypothetical protein
MQSVVVNVELYGVIRDLVREKNVEVTLPAGGDGTYRDVLGELGARFGPAFRERILDASGQLLSFVKLYVGGRRVDDLDQALSTRDGPVVRIIVFAAAGGG